MTAEEYQCYLKQYTHRYAINIHRRARVESIEKGMEQAPYVVNLELAAWAVVDATGKHHIPRKTKSDDVASKLDSCRMPYVHSTDMWDDASWS